MCKHIGKECRPLRSGHSTSTLRALSIESVSWIYRIAAVKGVSTIMTFNKQRWHTLELRSVSPSQQKYSVEVAGLVDLV